MIQPYRQNQQQNQQNLIDIAANKEQLEGQDSFWENIF